MIEKKASVRSVRGNLAIRLMFDASLAVGMLAFAASLWGIPELKQLGVAIVIGLSSALASFVFLFFIYSLIQRSNKEEDELEENPAIYEPKKIKGREFHERSIDDYTLSVNSVTQNQQTVITGFTPKRTPAFPTEWTVDLIETLEWRVFDRLCVAYWRIQGNGVNEFTSASLSGVNSIITPTKRSSVPLSIIQSRSAQSTSVSVAEMQELLKLKIKYKAPLVVLMYAGKLSNVVKSFCMSNNIRLISAENLHKGIQALSNDKQARLLDTLIRPDYMIPSCPKCSIKLVKRKRKDTGRIFWGCISYPDCRFNMDYVTQY